MLKHSSAPFNITRINKLTFEETEDQLAVEEPLEIRLLTGVTDARQMKSVSVTMRTPGNDAELAAGFLFTEGIIQSPDQIQDIFNNPEDCDNRQQNIIVVSIREDITLDLGKLERHFYTSSSCGVCGKASINAIHTLSPLLPATGEDFAIPCDILQRLPELLSGQQEVFRFTGGLHASAIFDQNGNILSLREDVGRHNALDKLVGCFFLADKLPLDQHILLLSGRASFELIQKAVAAGIKIVAAVGAPSSLAVELAQTYNITLVGFLRKERFNIYSGSQRVIL